MSQQVPELSTAFQVLPAVIPPTTRFNFIKNWWQRSEKSSNIAQARIIQRIPSALPSLQPTTAIPILARVGRISIDLNDTTTKQARQINTLYISQQPTQLSPFRFESESADLLDSIQQETSNQNNLVICHGYGAGLGFFYRNFQSLSQKKGWRIFAIDWLGMGNSSRPKWTIAKSSNQTWDDIVQVVEDHFVESLESWRSNVGIDKMTLMGHSLGGYFATCYALKYPDRVQKLILVSPAGIPENSPQKQHDITTDSNPQQELQKEASEISASYQAEAAAAEQQQKEPVQNNTTTATVVRTIPAWVTYLWDRNVTPMSIIRCLGPFGPSLVYNYASRRFAHLDESEQHDLYDYLYHITSSSGSGEFALAAILAPGAYARKPLFHRLAQLKMPTVFIYGDHDWMDYRAAERAKRHMSAPVKVIRVVNGGHHMYLDNPEEFNHIIRREMESDDIER
ncbi:MAG: Alpha/Beta hydrolase protein [Benjaminiella poitrasii]|nr:MAG: Alpha/Beta hydrolase protein [Benjaminiella poitrasii]